MRVRFTGVAGFDQRISRGASRLRDGREYVVLEVFTQVDDANFFRIETSEDLAPGLYDSRLFEVISDRIPNSWKMHREPSGSLTIGPSEWNEQGFWEAFMDDEEWAVVIYRAGRKMTLEDS